MSDRSAVESSAVPHMDLNIDGMPALESPTTLALARSATHSPRDTIRAPLKKSGNRYESSLFPSLPMKRLRPPTPPDLGEMKETMFSLTSRIDQPVATLPILMAEALPPSTQPMTAFSLRTTVGAGAMATPIYEALARLFSWQKT
ncbi:hypothetical protein Pmani_014431 [Petrolisthes manimaculis]|uniref:Uncharacterized protein n=1 Tax=Petrolisthes manimaculis TaxID=1843537 RepID=A0AAE1PSX3_9EUCA|nr:hypothetical protein Pmani_014431 [Petrolisthes manimaculis]